VIRLDIRSDVGNYLAYVFSVRAVPAFLMFGADGRPAGRHGGIASEKTLSGLLNEAIKER
jgi:thioredoxin-like negative regulator of GroEL